MRVRILFLIVLIFFLGTTSLKSEKNIFRNQFNKSTISLVKHFTNYYLHLKNIPLDGLSGFCDMNMYKNVTEMTFHSKIDICINNNFLPRHLSPSQVTWKSNRKEKSNEKSKKSHENSNADVNSISDSDTDTKEIVHPYLAFALLLPNHAFSQDLYQALVTVSPMFPFVTLVVGSGHEFRELCSQYNIRSFPKLLLFKAGILIGRYDSPHDPVILSQKIAKWTGRIPSAYPIPRNVSLNNRLLQSRKKGQKGFLCSWDIFKSTFLCSFDSKNEELKPSNYSIPQFYKYLKMVLSSQQSVEPFMGTFENFSDYDFVVFVLCGLYVIFRLISFCRSMVH